MFEMTGLNDDRIKERRHLVVNAVLGVLELNLFYNVLPANSLIDNQEKV